MIQKELLDGFRSIFDSEYINYKMPKDETDTLDKWGKVFNDYYMTMLMPIPGRINPFLSLGITTFKNQLSAMIKSQSVDLEILVTNLHNIIISGVDSTGLWVTTPPPVSLNLKVCLLTGNYQGKALSVCNCLATNINNFVHQTKSTNTISGITIVWI